MWDSMFVNPRIMGVKYPGIWDPMVTFPAIHPFLCAEVKKMMLLILWTYGCLTGSAQWTALCYLLHWTSELWMERNIKCSCIVLDYFSLYSFIYFHSVQMTDFEKLLQTVDNRLLAALDLRYEVKECTFSEPRSTRDALKRDATESYINPTFRLIRASHIDLWIMTTSLRLVSNPRCRSLVANTLPDTTLVDGFEQVQCNLIYGSMT